MTLLIRYRRSNYRLLGPVGHGQFGRVYCATHRQTGELVAIKRLNQQRLPTHAFLKELRYLLSVNHPHIVAYRALEHTAAGRQLVLEYCEGGTLRSLMERQERLSHAEILALLSDTLTGLAHAHQRGIVHCDIKPENILLSYRQQRWVAKVSDFGIARLAQEFSPTAAYPTGSPAYMAPERFYAHYSPASDVYALGVMLFELLTGTRPFSGTPEALRWAHLNQPPPSPESLQEPFRTLVLKALEKLPARRYASAAEMLAALPSRQDQALWRPPPAPVGSGSAASGVPFQGVPLQSLSAPVEQLVVGPPCPQTPATVDRWLYRGSGSCLSVSPCPTPDDHSLGEPAQAVAPANITALHPLAQGCCVVTETAVYVATPFGGPEPRLRLQRLAPLERPALTAVAPNGRWMVLVAPVAASPHQYAVTIRSLRPRAETGYPAARLCRTVMLSPPFQVQQVIAIDNRHALLLGQSGESVSQLHLLSRRGQWLGQLSLAMPIAQLVATAVPYRYLALTGTSPRSALILDLKPFRMLALQLPLAPALMAALDWGYLLANRQGRLLLLDRDARSMGSFEGPPNPSALLPISAYEILVATWQGQHGQLYTLNLKEGPVEILG